MPALTVLDFHVPEEIDDTRATWPALSFRLLEGTARNGCTQCEVSGDFNAVLDFVMDYLDVSYDDAEQVGRARTFITVKNS